MVWDSRLPAGGVAVPRSRSWLVAMSIRGSVVVLIWLTIIGVAFASTSTAGIVTFIKIKRIENVDNIHFIEKVTSKRGKQSGTTNK